MRGFWGVRKLGGLVGLVARGISGFLENCKGSMGNSPLPYQPTIINSMKTLCIALKQVLGSLAKWRLKLKSSIWLPSSIRATQSSSRNNRCQRVPFQILWRTKLSLLYSFLGPFDIFVTTFFYPTSKFPTRGSHPSCKKMQKVEEDYVMCLTNCFEGEKGTHIHIGNCFRWWNGHRIFFKLI